MKYFLIFNKRNNCKLIKTSKTNYLRILRFCTLKVKTILYVTSQTILGVVSPSGGDGVAGVFGPLNWEVDGCHVTGQRCLHLQGDDGEIVVEGGAVVHWVGGELDAGDELFRGAVVDRSHGNGGWVAVDDLVG